MSKRERDKLRASQIAESEARYLAAINKPQPKPQSTKEDKKHE